LALRRGAGTCKGGYRRRAGRAHNRTVGWHEGHGWQPVALVVRIDRVLLAVAARLGAGDDGAGLVVAGRAGGGGAGGGEGGQHDEGDERKLATH
jgi:hypothetical protein